MRRSEASKRVESTRVDSAKRITRQHDLHNERVVLAAALVDVRVRDKLVVALEPGVFVADKHGPIWAALCEAKRRGIDADPAGLRAIDSDVDESYVVQLIAERPDTPLGLDSHLEALKWDSACARIVTGPLDALNRALADVRSDPERVRALARQVESAVAGAAKRSAVLDPHEIVRRQANDIDQRSTQVACYPVGIEGLDKDKTGAWRIVPGLKPGKITLVTAVSGSCKSTLTAKIVSEQETLGKRVLYGSWEMGAGETLELLASIALGQSRYRIATGGLSLDERAAFKQRMTDIAQRVKMWRFPWRHDDRPRYNDEVLDRLHAGIADSGCDLVVFDLWRRCLVDRRIDEEEAALERMQQMAEETRTHFIICHQQRLKDIELRKDKRPTREGIKGTSVWVDVPDTILGVHLPSLWKNVPADTIEIDILKQRYGKWPLAIEFDWDGDRVQLSNAREVDYNASSDDKRDALSNWVDGD